MRRPRIPVTAALVALALGAPDRLQAHRSSTMQAARPRAPRAHAGRCQTPTTPSVTANGRYHGLLKKLSAPGDCRVYGSFRDYGWWSYGQYAGHANLPAAYWVYHYPHWYLYQTRRGVKAPPQPPRPPTPPPAPRCHTPKKPNPSVNGRYYGLIRRIRLPADCPTYHSFYEWGRYGATSYGGHANLPAAYWVYHYPYWYLWRHRRP